MISKINAIKYPSTNQFRNVCQHIVQMHQSVFDIETNEYTIDRTLPLPTLTYVGTVKIHGTNGSIVKYADGRIYKQSKSRILDITHDNNGFFEAMSNIDLNVLFDAFTKRHIELHGHEPTYPIVIAGEWAGKGIQAGVAVSEVPKFFTIFSIRTGEQPTPESDLVTWHNIANYKDIALRERRIYNICDFGIKLIDIDFENPLMVTQALVDDVNEVEAECPVGKYFGINGVGEGRVWSPVDSTYMSSPNSWFKCKGTKHSVSKVKTLVAICPEKLNSISEFVDYAVTENRMDQGITEIGLDVKLTGKFIGWINQDIYKEEADTLLANDLTMKDIGSRVADKARKYYMSKV